MAGSPGKLELDLENERVVRTGIVSGVPDDLEIGLQFGHRGELKHIVGFDAEFVLVDEHCRTGRGLAPDKADADPVVASRGGQAQLLQRPSDDKAGPDLRRRTRRHGLAAETEASVPSNGRMLAHLLLGVKTKS